MKTNPHILLRQLALCALVLTGSPQLLARTNVVSPGLSFERSGGQLILRWTGGDGIRLQKANCFCGVAWEDVPDPDTNCTAVVTMNEPTAFFRLVDANADTDADFLTRAEEEAGWTIFIDTSGYGEARLVELDVTSDPELADTDGDGLTDFEEWICGTDSRSTDTDHDGLSDYNEVFRWHTSPTSVDTDGDARGPNHDLPPKMQLFDGKELSLLHTSPTLEDTDGDGRTDYEEYDQLGRSPLVAQLPKLEVELVDAVDIRLDVEYAEEAGTSRQYGGELTTSESSTDTKSNSDSVNASLKAGYATTIGLNPQAMWNVELTVGYEHTWTSEHADSESTENSYSDYTTDSRTRTETAASGSMSGGIRLRNTGPVTYTLTDFGTSVRYWMRGGTSAADGEFKTLATLVPTLGANGITLAPGDSTPVLQVQATGLNASRVKEFMARPNSLYLEPAFYEMENAEGLNFDFLEEVTRWRTARVQIDFGDGRSEDYRIATNVERNEDGSFAGVTMGNVMSNIINVPFQTRPTRDLLPAHPSNARVLCSVRDLVTTNPTNGFWAVFLSDDRAPQTPTHFEDIVLQAGDEIILTFIRDEDGDGLFAPEEQHYGTTEALAPDAPAPSDTDGDGLTDVFEARTGWDLVVLGRTNRVYSDPRQVDQDADGLTDLQEFEKGTDPTRPDTDADGLADAADPHPLVPARVIRVKWNAVPGGTSGATWATALTNLQDALSLARTGLTTPLDPADDVAEIWVAAGVYKPTTTTNNRAAYFELVNNTSLYGGFSGVETKLNQRVPNPLYNGTVLSGDLLNNDATTYDTNSFADNSSSVCVAWYVGAGTVLDGFTLTGGNRLATGTSFGAGLAAFGQPRLRNLLFRANHGASVGALSCEPEAGNSAVVSDCLFLQNAAGWNGGGIYATVSASSGLALTNCQFIQNEAGPEIGYGGGLYVTGSGSVSIESCIFRLNKAKISGGAAWISGKTRISKTRFHENTSVSSGGGVAGSNLGSDVEVVQSVFWKNSATGPTTSDGGAMVFWGPSAIYVLNSSFNSNSCARSGGAIRVANGAAKTVIENSVLWGNVGGAPVAVDNWLTQLQVRTSDSPDASQFPSAGNISADPKFVNPAQGDLRLQSGSPCLDAGNDYIDYYPLVFGYQPLPDTDIDRLPRVSDGNADGMPTVDMGAHERQGN